MPDTQLGRRLDSWKEIAAYLGCDVRTARRWEKERGLPIRRPRGEKRGLVFAYTSEIDAWRNGQPTPLTIGSNHAPRPGLYGRLVIALVLALGLTSAGLFLWPRNRPGDPASVVFEGNKVVALDGSGRRVWEYDHPRPLFHLEASDTFDWSHRNRAVDLDGDGRRELLVFPPVNVTPQLGAGVRAEIDCFSPDGRLLWRYEPRAALTFGNETFTGPWRIHDMFMTGEGRSARLWVLVQHHAWWPSFLAEIDTATGAASVRFVNSGYLFAINRAQDARGSFLVLGGFNNEYDLGFLAVLADDQAASSPQTLGSTFACHDCPVGGPLRYYLVPRSELNRLLNVNLNAVRFLRLADAHLEAATYETPERYGAFYSFAATAELTPLSFSLEDRYWRVHRQLEQEGRLDHPAERCPDRIQPLLVKMWIPDRGWTQARISYAARN